MSKDWRKSYKVQKGLINALDLVESNVPIGTTSFPNDRLLIGTIHEGECIPEEHWNALQEAAKSKPKLNEIFEHRYAAERDWGADLVSSALIDSLNEKGYPCPYFFRVNIARVLMDFGRFPGTTPAKASHLSRFAINYPFSGLLNYSQKKSVLENYYDQISQKIESVIKNKTLNIAIHTYDKYNKAGTERPLMSVITRPLSYQTTSEMPLEFFDPLYPPILGEYTADRKLTYRLSLTLEQAGIPVAHNYPYNFPDGSVEMRAQVWFFFQHLRKHFEERHPDSSEDPSFQQIWNMLLDTNLRSTESENLRSYLHMFRKAPAGEEKIFRDARKSYERLHLFLNENYRQLVTEFRNSPERPNSLGIEVRKDFVWEFADEKCRYPIRPKPENAKIIADVLAKALLIYFTEDKTC